MNTISLGGVALSGALVISDRGESFAVAQAIKRTLAGGLKVYFASLQKGQNVTLVADESQGWITGAMNTALYDMAMSAGAVYELLVNGASRSVIFRHHEPPAYVSAPLVYRNNQQAEDYFTCTIKLLTV